MLIVLLAVAVASATLHSVIPTMRAGGEAEREGGRGAASNRQFADPPQLFYGYGPEVSVKFGALGSVHRFHI